MKSISSLRELGLQKMAGNSHFLVKRIAKIDEEGQLREYILDDTVERSDIAVVQTKTTVLINNINGDLEPVDGPEM